MKKGSFNFLGKKDQSLFGTNVEFKEMDNVELVLDSSAIPESGTAKVRSRPTVKHFTSSEGVQGFAVPTPKVPILPPFQEPKINGTGSTTNLPKARMLSVPDIIEGEILIPPPPSAAPPPPPTFIPVPPQYFGEMDPSVKLASLQPPPMAPPKPPSLAGSVYSSDLDMASLKPPQSETSSIRGSLSSLELQDIPDCPKFTPPPPPGGKAQPVLDKSPKAAPLKPVRMSSIPNLDIQSQIPTPPVASNPTPSSFNPQNTAKLYDVQKSTFLLGQSDKEKVQSILLLEDSSANSVVVVNGNSGKNGGSLQPVHSVVPPTKPARRNSSATLLQNDQPDSISQPAKVEVKVNPEPVMVQNIRTEVPTPIQVSPRIGKKLPDVRQVMESPGRSRRNSPLVNHRQLNTQGVDGTVKKETSTSPFALLLAAKERDKQRAALSQQNSNSTEQIQPSAEKPNSFTVTPDSPNAQLKTTQNVQALTKAEVSNASHSTPQQSSPMNSSVGGLGVPVRDVESGEDLTFIPPPPEFANSDTEDEPSVPPASHLVPAPQPSTPTPIFNCPPPSHPAPAAPVKTTPQPSKTLPPAIINCPPPSHPAPAPPVKTASQPSKILPSTPTPIFNCPPPSHPAPAAPVKTASQSSKTFSPLIINCPPPSHPAPGPPVTLPKTLPATPAPIINSPPPSHPAPVKSAPTPYLPTQIPNGALPSHVAPPVPPTKPSPPATPPPVTNGPRVSPKPKPPTYPPKAPGPPPNLQLQSKPVQTKATQPPAQGPPSVSASQATLLSILQKKMLEMDPKFSAAKEVESNGDDWNSPLSDEETPSYPSKTRSATLPVQSHGLDLKELESKAAKKVQATSAKSQNSPGSSSKQQHGMTFTVRPGTKQPITPVSRD